MTPPLEEVRLQLEKFYGLTVEFRDDFPLSSSNYAMYRVVSPTGKLVGLIVVCFWQGITVEYERAGSDFGMGNLKALRRLINRKKPKSGLDKD